MVVDWPAVSEAPAAVPTGGVGGEGGRTAKLEEGWLIRRGWLVGGEVAGSLGGGQGGLGRGSLGKKMNRRRVWAVCASTATRALRWEEDRRANRGHIWNHDECVVPVVVTLSLYCYTYVYIHKRHHTTY